MLLDLMHLVKVVTLPEFLPSPSPPVPHLTLPDGHTGTRASIHVNLDDTLVLSEHLVVQRSHELRSHSGQRSCSLTHQLSIGGRSCFSIHQSLSGGAASSE